MFSYRPAYNVLLRDASFPPTDFEVVSGMLEAKWDSIDSGANATHAVILKPLRPGYFNFTSADVTYQTSENSEEKQVLALSYRPCLLSNPITVVAAGYIAMVVHVNFPVLQICYSSAPGEGGIVSLKEFERVFSSHIVSICTCTNTIQYNLLFGCKLIAVATDLHLYTTESLLF